MAETQLTLDDLWQQCQECGGSGTQKPGALVGSAFQIAAIQCPKCQGSKGQPTSTGRAVMEFLRLAKSTGWRL